MTASPTPRRGAEAGASAPQRRTLAAEVRHAVGERWDVLAVIAVGGGLGSIARWAVSGGAPLGIRHTPWATWLENVTGALALGALMVLVLDVWPPRRYLRPFLGVGVLGGYTTFSTYMLDTRDLAAGGDTGGALLYLFGTLVSGLVAVWAGMLASRLAIRLLRSQHHRHNGASTSRRTPEPDDDIEERSAR